MGKAKQKFDQTMSRCDAMINLYDTLKEKGESPTEDILRGAIVLSVAAFDAYATDCFSEHFVRYIKDHKIDESVIKLLTDAHYDIKFSIELLKAERPYRKIRTLIDKYYAKVTTQRMEVIDSLFTIYHLDSITFNAANKTGRKPENLLKSINLLIERRHQIVHDGDYNDYCVPKSITKTDLNRIELIKIFVDSMDTIIDSKFRKTKKKKTQ